MSALDRYWLGPAPAARLSALRLLIGAFCFFYLIARGHVMADFSGMDPARFEPVGTAVLLSGPLPRVLEWTQYGACLLLSVAFALGLRHRISGPVFALLFLWVTSYRNSWGMIFHTDNLTVMHALVVGLSPAAADCWSLDRPGASDAEGGRYGWPIRLMCAVTVVVYVIAGLAKLRNSGWDWAEGEILRNYIAYDGARKAALGSIHSPLGAWLVQHAWPFPIIGFFTFVIELGAPLAMLGGRFAYSWVAGIWAFHVGVLTTMAIAFPYPLSGVAFACFLPAERIFEWKLTAPVRRLLA